MGVREGGAVLVMVALGVSVGGSVLNKSGAAVCTPVLNKSGAAVFVGMLLARRARVGKVVFAGWQPINTSASKIQYAECLMP